MTVWVGLLLFKFGLAELSQDTASKLGLSLGLHGALLPVKVALGLVRGDVVLLVGLVDVQIDLIIDQNTKHPLIESFILHFIG